MLLNVADMLVNELAMKCRETAYYLQQTHNPDIYIHYALKGEVGELLNIAKKMMRNDGNNYRPQFTAELGDIWYYFIEVLTQNQITLYNVIQAATLNDFGIAEEETCFALVDANWSLGIIPNPYSIQALKPDLDELYKYAWILDYQRNPSGYVDVNVAADFFNVLMKIHRKASVSTVEAIETALTKIQSRGANYYVGFDFEPSEVVPVRPTDEPGNPGCSVYPKGTDEQTDCGCS